MDYCQESDVCCPDTTVCGTGVNGCPMGGCCSVEAEPEAGIDANDNPDAWQVVNPPGGSGGGGAGGGARPQ
jgi:hypothetical protein